jgi:hypothetical protein
LSRPAPRPSTDAADVAAVIDGALACVKGLDYLNYSGYQVTPATARLQALKERLVQGRFHLAVLGQFKRGKSTLLNALLGVAVLPASVVPLTAIPTFIRSGKALRARVSFQDGRPPEEVAGESEDDLRAFLERFVSEEGNPENRRGVSQAEVFHPAGVLRGGVVLIDTPGIGSTLRHNTEATLGFLPQCDAALFVLSADPPVTEAELVFLEQVRAQVPRLFFVLNKVDYLSPEETVAATDFLRATLSERAGISQARIFLVSARQGLLARSRGDAALWSRSGMAEVEGDLLTFLATEKSAALREAVAQKAADALGDLLLQLGLVVRSLEMPLEDLERKLAVLAEKIEEAKGQSRHAKDLLAGDRLRLREFLEDHASALRSQAVTHLEGRVEAAMPAANAAGDAEGGLQEMLAGEILALFERQSREATGLVRQRTAEVLRLHQQRADELTFAIRGTAADLFELPRHAPDSSGAFETVRQPYWVTRQGPSLLEPIPPGAWDAFLPAGIRRRRLEARWRGRVHDLVTRNVENLRWALFQNIDEAFLRFGSSLAQSLAETVALTHGAVATAAAGKTHHEAAREDIVRLRRVQEKLMELKAALKPDGGA